MAVEDEAGGRSQKPEGYRHPKHYQFFPYSCVPLRSEKKSANLYTLCNEYTLQIYCYKPLNFRALQAKEFLAIKNIVPEVNEIIMIF